MLKLATGILIGIALTITIAHTWRPATIWALSQGDR